MNIVTAIYIKPGGLHCVPAPSPVLLALAQLPRSLSSSPFPWMDRAGIRRVFTSITSTLVVENKNKMEREELLPPIAIVGTFLLNFAFQIYLILEDFFISFFFRLFLKLDIKVIFDSVKSDKKINSKFPKFILNFS